MSISFWTADCFHSLPWLRHGFTHRGGGVSTAGFSSLNLGLHVGDDPDAVRENRRRAAEALDFPLANMVCAEQVHGAAVAVVTAAHAGRGATSLRDTIPGADALVTDSPGVLLTLFFADCVPVFFADPVRRVVAVAHAGWRGLVRNVLENTMDTMIEQFGSAPVDLRVAVGPCIGTEWFEVGSEVAEQFASKFVHLPERGGKPHIDLAAAARERIVARAVPEAQISLARECTASDTDRYFSHRRDNGVTGRMAAMIGIPERQ